MNDPIVQALAESLDNLQSGKMTLEECLERYPGLEDELAPLLDMAVDLQSVPSPEIRPQFAQTARTRLMKKIAVTEEHSSVTFLQRLRYLLKQGLRTNWSVRPATALVLIVVLLGALLGVGTVQASGQALPGDLLYPVKTTLEDVQITFSGPERATQLRLEFLKVRESEIQQLVTLGRFDQVTSAVNQFEAQAGEVSSSLEILAKTDPASALSLSSEYKNVLANNVTVLESLLTKVPPQAQQAIQHAIDKATQQPSATPEINDTLPPGQQKKLEATPTPPAVEPTKNNGKPTDSPGKKPTDVTNGNLTEVPNEKPTEKPHPTHPPTNDNSGSKPKPTKKN